MKSQKKSAPANSILPVLIVLHLAVFLNSFGGICSKKAALSPDWKGTLFWYSGVLFIMAVYAVIWQQILRRLPLTTAYANKPAGLVWSMLWGRFLFHETITWKMIAAAAVICLGIYFVVTSDE